MDTLRIDRAGPEDEPVFERLFQLYFHDFSDWSGEDVGGDGLFDAWDDSTFDNPGSAAYLLRVDDGQLAGFLVTETVDTPMGPRTEFADLFVLRKYRGRGIAREVVRRVMLGSGHPWVVAVFRGDMQALRFWERVFEQLPFDSVRPFTDPRKPQYHFFSINDGGDVGATPPG